MRQSLTLAVVLAAALAAGCGGSDSNDDGGQAAAAATPTTTPPPATSGSAFLTRVNEVIATPDAGSASPVDTTGIDATPDNSGEPQAVRRPG